MKRKFFRLTALVLILTLALCMVAFADESNKTWMVNGYAASGRVNLTSSGAGASTEYEAIDALSVSVLAYYRLGATHYDTGNSMNNYSRQVSTSCSLPSGAIPIEATGTHSVSGSSINTYYWY